MSEQPPHRAEPDDELHLSADPDPAPGTDVKPEKPAGLGEPAEHPDPPADQT